MSLPNNSFQTVQTYQLSELAYLQNLNCFIATANTRFKDFNKMQANLGDTVLYDLPPKFVTANSLVATFQPSVQRQRSLTVSQAYNVSTDYTNQQWIFNLEPMDYMKQFGKSAIMQLSGAIEAQVASNVCNLPFRFYGDGVTPINSYGQLGKMLAYYRNFGAPVSEVDVYLSDLAVPDIINSGLNQFTPDRNDKLQQSWMIGSFDRANFYRSNLLPIHYAGTVGNASPTASPSNVLTVVSTNDPTGANITSITFSGATASDASAILAGDLFQFNDGVSGKTNLRYLTFNVQTPSSNPLQCQAAANATADGSGNVTITLTAALSTSNFYTNLGINTNIIAGMTATVMPTCRKGVVVGGNALFLAMPQLPDEDPFKTVNAIDKDTGVSTRIYWGSLFGQNQRGMVHDCIWGSDLPPEYGMSVLFPL